MVHKEIAGCQVQYNSGVFEATSDVRGGPVDHHSPQYQCRVLRPTALTCVSSFPPVVTAIIIVQLITLV
jgi:hypothetical protein